MKPYIVFLLIFTVFLPKNKKSQKKEKINNEKEHHSDGNNGMHEAEFETVKENRPNLQIINKRIDPDKLNCNYYNRIRREIKKQIKEDADILLINLDTNEPIKERYKVESLLHLQREFTDIIIKPKSTVDDQELNDWIEFFKPKAIMSSI